MSFTTRLGGWLLVLSLSCHSDAFALAQPASAASSIQSSTDETVLPALVEAFYKTWAVKDLDGYLRLWSGKSPELEARKKATAELFASSEKIELKSLVVRQIKLDGDKARVRVEADAQVIEAQTGKARAGYRKMLRTLEYVREEGNWKVWRESSTFDALAAALAAAKTEEESAALLAEEKELVTADLVRALIEQGNRFYERGSFPQALAINRAAHKLAEQLGDQAGLARALNSIGNLHWVMGDYSPALTSFQQSLALSEKLGDQLAVAGTLRNLGNLHYVQGNWDQALELFRKGTQMSEALGDRLGVARGLGSLGVVADTQGEFGQALNYYQQALTQFEALADQLGRARTLGNLAIVYGQQGNYAQALYYHQQSLLLFEAKGDQAGSARTLHNIAITHLFQGNHAQALDYGQQALRLREKLKDKPGTAKTLAHLGNVYYEQGDYTQALAYHQWSLQLREAMNDKEGVAEALNNLGAIQLERGQHALALQHFRQSLALREQIGFKLGIASTLVFFGKVHERQSQPALALDYAERAAALARQIGDTDTLRQARFTTGVAQRALSQLAEARQAFEEAIAVTETLRAQIAGGEEGQQRFFASKVAPYHALISLLVAQGQPPEALTFAERTKARVLLDVLRQGRFSIQKALTPAEAAQERRLKAELTQLNAQQALATQADKPDPQRINEFKPRLEKARLNYEALQTSLYAAHPELRAQRGEAPVVKAEELAALVPDDASALLEYVVTDDVTYLFAITKAADKPTAEVQVYILPIKRDELSKQTESLRRQLAARDLGFRAAAKQLYQLLLKPAQAQLAGKTNIVIVPDDKLWELPFQALLGERDRYVIETSAISYAPSLTVLREMQTQRSKRPAPSATAALLALGNPALGRETVERAKLALRDGKLDPLPEAEAEVKALGQLYGATRSKVYVGAEAREDRAKSEAAQANILHFATHGILNDAAPLYSHLVLAQGDKNEDGLLEAWELLQLDLKADLAVLSACETARGRASAGEGVIGLTWALFVAGVPATVVSQWKVESASTRELMLSFYRQLSKPPATAKAQVTKAEALRQAALALMKKPETSHPFYWAGFVLVGDGR